MDRLTDKATLDCFLKDQGSLIKASKVRDLYLKLYLIENIMERQSISGVEVLEYRLVRFNELASELKGYMKGEKV